MIEPNKSETIIKSQALEPVRDHINGEKPTKNAAAIISKTILFLSFQTRPKDKAINQHNKRTMYEKRTAIELLNKNEASFNNPTVITAETILIIINLL